MDPRDRPAGIPHLDKLSERRWRRGRDREKWRAHPRGETNKKRFRHRAPADAKSHARNRLREFQDSARFRDIRSSTRNKATILPALLREHKHEQTIWKLSGFLDGPAPRPRYRGRTPAV